MTRHNKKRLPSIIPGINEVYEAKQRTRREFFGKEDVDTSFNQTYNYDNQIRPAKRSVGIKKPSDIASW